VRCQGEWKARGGERRASTVGCSTEWLDRWMGGCDCDWISGWLLCAVATCVPYTHCHMAHHLPTSNFDCLFAYFLFLFLFIFLILFIFFLLTFCDLKLVYYLPLISNFLRIILGFYLFSP